jgi:hypothetical protein
MKMVTLKILTSVEDEAKINKWLERITQDYRVVKDYDTNFSAVNQDIIRRVNADTYSPGDVFGDWLIFSPSMSEGNPMEGFYSNAYGWGSYDLATRYDFTAEIADITKSSVGSKDASLVPDYGPAFFNKGA